MHQTEEIHNAMKESDLVILAGAVCDKFLRFGLDLPKNVISVNLNKKEMLLVSLILPFSK
jgi:hypothetical protein